MKTFKISSFIRGLVVAFAMSMFLPSVASATCTVSCEPYSKYEEYYKKLAAEQLALYNTTNNYCYYTAYLCYSKKATYFKQTFEHCEVKNSAANASACNVNKTIADHKKTIADTYKKYADYYHDLYVKYGYACYEISSTHYMNKYDYFIKLYNDYLDKYNECSKNLDGKFCDIQKIIAEKKKVIADGYKKYADYYHELYVTYGHACYENTSKHYMTKYDYFMNLYNDYMDKYNECKDKYTPRGDIYGNIFYDENENKQYDNGEIGQVGIKVTIVDANGNVFNVLTDDKGNYSQTGLVIGEAIVTIDLTSILGLDPEIIIGMNPHPVTVVANQNTNVGRDGYSLGG